MVRRIVISLSALMLVLSGMSQNIPETGSLAFHFKHVSPPQKVVLSLDLMQNRTNMATLTNGISKGKESILAGRRYISIVPCISRDNIQNAEAVNIASQQASVIRAFIKTECGIPHECIAFAIDTTQNLSDVVMINIFEGELPQGKDSGTIQYILTGSSAEIFSKYESGVPYGNIWMIQERAKNKN